MGRAPCCDKASVKKGPWSPEEDEKLKAYIEKLGTGGNWIALPQKAGLKRCGKSCRLRWLNYLRPNIKHGDFSDDEDRIICTLYANIGSRWSIIAAQLPGRTDNDIKNYWNTKLKKKLIGMMMIHPNSQRILPNNYSSLLQSSSLPSSPSTFKCSSNNTYYDHTISTGAFPFSSLMNHNNNNNNNNLFTVLQNQESFIGNSLQNYQVKESNNLLVFGGEASCSSSDGGGASCFYNGVEETQKVVGSGGDGLLGDNQNQNQIDEYGLEEIKQLISTSSCNNFLFDKNKTEEEVVMYY